MAKSIKLKVLGQDWELVEDPNVLKMENPAWGLCDKYNKVMLVHDLTDWTTILHELGHAAFWEASLNQTSIHPDIEEIIVESFQKVLLENFEEPKWKKKKTTRRKKKA